MLELNAVLFDLDGTLMNSEGAWHQALNSVLKNHGKEEISREEYDRLHVGKHPKEDVAMHFPEFSGDQLEKAVVFYENEFAKMISYIKFHPHAVEVLEYCKNLKKKIGIGMVTSMRWNVLDEILQHFDMKKYFDFVQSGDNVKPKPNPEPVLLACAKLGVKPEHTLYVEDSVSGVKAGKSAGCYTIAITYTTQEEKLKEAGADRIIHSLIELKDIIKN